MLLELDKKVELEIIDRALAHIKKVELNPEVETDGDNFDYWNSYKLEDGNYVDYNIYCGDDVGESPFHHGVLRLEGFAYRRLFLLCFNVIDEQPDEIEQPGEPDHHSNNVKGLEPQVSLRWKRQCHDPIQRSSTIESR